MSLFEFDQNFRNQYSLLAGVDEAGRGAWAGPVVAAAVILDPQQPLEGVNDSKKLTPKKREALFDQIKSKALSYGIALVEAAEIDQINILEASKKAMCLALAQLDPKPQMTLVDGNMTLDYDLPQQYVISGDAKSQSIAAASILAKVYRDNLMVDLAQNHPGFGFEKHKGYGTKAHQEALSEFGVLSLHRCSYGPIQRLINQSK